MASIPHSTRLYRSLPGVLAAALLLSTLGSVLTSCAHTREHEGPPPVPVREVVKWSHENVPAKTMIERMRRSGTVYRLSAAQLAHLETEGVPDRVLNYMQQTYLHAVERDQRLKDRRYWAEGPDGYYYGGPAYWYWPDVDFGDDFGFGDGFGEEEEGGEGEQGDDDPAGSGNGGDDSH